MNPRISCSALQSRACQMMSRLSNVTLVIMSLNHSHICSPSPVHPSLHSTGLGRYRWLLDVRCVSAIHRMCSLRRDTPPKLPLFALLPLQQCSARAPSGAFVAASETPALFATRKRKVQNRHHCPQKSWRAFVNLSSATCGSALTRRENKIAHINDLLLLPVALS